MNNCHFLDSDVKLGGISGYFCWKIEFNSSFNCVSFVYGIIEEFQPLKTNTVV